jgi:CheY-like chemotaxis protein
MPSPEAHPVPASIELEIASVYRLYAALAREMDSESGLGGKLLYGYDLDGERCRLLRAANIAGAASLAASADPAVARQAMRDGAVDFVVTSLDEALRILKNEIRKRQAVAVAVTAPPEAMEREMLDRGVQPDLLAAPPAGPELAAFLAKGARCVVAQPLPPPRKFLVWPVPDAWATRTAEFDALLLQRLAADNHANRRWLRLSPRYLGYQARRLRSLECSVEAVSEWNEWFGRQAAG